ncbi:MAG TPA: methyltransferase domain-containing protein [Acidimicrobiia bacterium]|nr:methyltransferase domain-containing protein [Acidimicrobiia bacterium]
MSHPDLEPAALDALRADLGDTAAGDGRTGDASDKAPGPVTPAAAPDAPDTPGTLRTRVKHAARETLRPYVGSALDRLAARLQDRVRESVRAELRSEYGPLESELQVVKARVDAIEGLLAPIVELGRANERVHVLEVNQELLKGELGAFHAALDSLGTAIAPAAGLAGVPERFAELRERVNAIDRELRRVRAGTSTPPGDAGAPPAVATTEPSSGFDYVGFEHRFRGDPAAVLAEQERRYADLLFEHQPVVDIGCGRGELLEVLASRGARVVGVEPDPGMAAAARARGLDIHETGAVEFLGAAEPASLGAITAIHVVEHLDLDTLVAFFELAATRLRAGGVLVVETPNPASLVVLGNSYVMDPTHVRPLHPALVTFLCERAGFRDVRLEFHAPASAYHLPLLPEPPAGTDAVVVEDVRLVNDAFRRLNDSLYGPQEYAAIATAAPARDV